MEAVQRDRGDLVYYTSTSQAWYTAIHPVTLHYIDNPEVEKAFVAWLILQNAQKFDVAVSLLDMFLYTAYTYKLAWGWHKDREQYGLTGFFDTLPKTLFSLCNAVSIYGPAVYLFLFPKVYRRRRNAILSAGRFLRSLPITINSTPLVYMRDSNCTFLRSVLLHDRLLAELLLGPLLHQVPFVQSVPLLLVGFLSGVLAAVSQFGFCAQTEYHVRVASMQVQRPLTNASIALHPWPNYTRPGLLMKSLGVESWPLAPDWHVCVSTVNEMEQGLRWFGLLAGYNWWRDMPLPVCSAFMLLATATMTGGMLVLIYLQELRWRFKFYHTMTGTRLTPQVPKVIQDVVTYAVILMSLVWGTLLEALVYGSVSVQWYLCYLPILVAMLFRTYGRGRHHDD